MKTLLEQIDFYLNERSEAMEINHGAGIADYIRDKKREFGKKEGEKEAKRIINDLLTDVIPDDLEDAARRGEDERYTNVKATLYDKGLAPLLRKLKKKPFDNALLKKVAKAYDKFYTELGRLSGY